LLGGSESGADDGVLERHGDAGLGCLLEEHLGRGAVLEAGERLEADDLSGLQVDDGLEHGPERLVGDDLIDRGRTGSAG
jgi:hypothetical protein